MSTITVSIDIEPMSLNQAYPENSRGRRTLSTKGRTYKEIIFWATKRVLIKEPLLIDPIQHFISMELHFFSPKFLTKGGEISKNKPDTSNCIKLTEDAICEALGIDDYLSVRFDLIDFSYSEKPKIIAILRRNFQSEKKGLLK